MVPLGLQTPLVAAYAVGLSAVGLWHIAAGDTTEQLFRDPRRVRLVGVLLLLMTAPCLAWVDQSYFVALAVILGASGVLRLAMPQLNIRVQRGLYPRWVHGWIMTAGGVALWAIYRWQHR